jgi:signal peptidase II
MKTTKTETPPSGPTPRESASRTASNERLRPPGQDPAWRRGRSLAIFLLLATAATGADLLTKHLAFERLGNDPRTQQRLSELRIRYAHHGPENIEPRRALRAASTHVKLIPGLSLTLSTNPGVVFGLPMPRWLVAVATVVAVVLIATFFAASGHRQHAVHVALALILGGAVGNLYDRLFSVVRVSGFGEIRYEVRDFIDCSALHWPWVFNLADVWLVAGVALMLVLRLRESLRQTRQ